MNDEQRVFTALTVACGPAVENSAFYRRNPCRAECAAPHGFNEESWNT